MTAPNKKVQHTREKRGQWSYQKGLWIENIACAFFFCKGYRILKRRYQTPAGEVDLLACRGGQLVVIEVKFRQVIGVAKESISTRQKQRLLKSGAWILSHQNRFVNKGYRYKKIRFEGIFFTPWSWPRHLKNIF